MNDLGVKYIATYADYTGYSTAARNAITALYLAGVNITTQRVDFIPESTVNVGWMRDLADSLRGRKIDYKVQLIELTAEHYPIYIDKTKYNIGVLFWETDRLPEPWIKTMKDVDEFWVFSKDQEQVFIRSGIKSKLTIIPQCIDYLYFEDYEPYKINDNFKFLSIFQWTERKNPKVLIQSFIKAFRGNKKVNLIVKTYRANDSKIEFDLIQEELINWKKEVTTSLYPEIVVCNNILNRHDLMRLYATCDCLVSTHRGEGWGMPQMEAMAIGKPIISTNYGGIHEYLNDEVAMLIPHKMIPVVNMMWIPWYTKNQKWAEIDKKALIEKMQWAYKHPKELKQMGLKAKKYTSALFDIRKVGLVMRDRLKEIYKTL